MGTRSALIWTIIAILAGVTYGIGMHYAWPQDTNAPDIQEWFAQLQNHMGGHCCGFSDGYPAEIVQMPTAKDPDGSMGTKRNGLVCVIDKRAKEVIKKGKVVASRPVFTGDDCRHFSWSQLTKEQQGNPLNHALMFIDRTASNMGEPIGGGIYCVVILPQIY